QAVAEVRLAPLLELTAHAVHGQRDHRADEDEARYQADEHEQAAERPCRERQQPTQQHQRDAEHQRRPRRAPKIVPPRAQPAERRREPELAARRDVGAGRFVVGLLVICHGPGSRDHASGSLPQPFTGNFSERSRASAVANDSIVISSSRSSARPRSPDRPRVSRRLSAPVENADFDAARRATSMALALASSTGTTWLTRPSSSRSRAFLRSPSTSSSMARWYPIACGSRRVTPPVTNCPHSISGKKATRSWAATTMSQFSIHSKPPPTA